MRKSKYLAALLFLIFSGRAPHASDYRIVTEEWPPYNYVENGKITGLATDIVVAIMKKTGDRFTISLVPSMRTTLTLRKSKKIIMISMFKTIERENLYKWVGPISKESIHPYELASAHPKTENIEQLKKAKKITTRHAGKIPDILESQGFINIDRAAAESPQLYKMLLAGRTNVIVGDSDAGVSHYLKKMALPSETLRRIPVTIYHSELYIAFSLDSDDSVVADWSKALEILRESGELQRITHRYK